MSSLFSEPRPKTAGYVRVAVERAVDRYPDGLTYAIPESLADLQPGERVIVPLGRGDQPTAAYIIDRSDSTELDPEKIKPVRERDSAAVRLPGEVMQLARWISGYYAAPIGMTLASMLPAAVKRNVGAVQRTMIDLAAPIPENERLSKQQRRVVEVLTGLPETRRPIEMRKLATLAEIKTTTPIRGLLDRELLRATRKTAIEAVWSDHAVDPFVPDALTSPQRTVIDAITGSFDAGFSVHLLHGVTGSGKTEVYIRLIERVVESGKVALMLVPEISLTPQTGGRLIGRFKDHRVAVLHSGLTAAQRHQQWALVASGAAPIVLGARSAVFAPLPDDRLGLILVDEEHDGSYKQDQVPRYHGRDVAIRRAQLSQCPIVLGSATPSLESWHNATVPADGANGRPRYTLHRLTERVPGAKLPAVRVVDFAKQMRQFRDRRVHLIGPVMLEALERVLKSGAQALILLNRRGYANYIACPDHFCGWTMQCDDCDVTMVYHKNRALPTGGYVRCHHCQSEQKLPKTCPLCGKHISTFGLGTQRVEEELTATFPDILKEGETLLRVDSDTMHGAKDFHDTLGRFGRGEVRVLVGTQMIAKGLDFPGVQLVGVINADTAINLPDFRAAERTFQLVSQVAGRSGRGTQPGVVIVQSFHPETPSIQLAAQHNYERFASIELKYRRECGLPPITRMVRLVLRDEDHVKLTSDARKTADALRALMDPSVRMRGPAPCPIARIAGKHRQQIELIAPGPVPLQKLLAAGRDAGILRAGTSMAIDVDPIALM
ncbi:MAG: primosomal protein N' [Phycisphaerales bacterium]|nr:MAG: primosomal protein N' [Phycisphaerales bacterium]